MTPNGGSKSGGLGVRDPFARPGAALPRATQPAAVKTAAPAQPDKEKPHTATGSLLVVGAGVMAVNQVTVETKGWIEQSAKVLCLGLDPVTEHWIESLNPKTETCDAAGAIGERALSYVREGLSVCVVHSGTVGAWRETIGKCRAEGFRATLAPAISVEDCFFSDLAIDPLRQGVQIYDCADFLVHRRQTDVSSGLLLRLVPSTLRCHPVLSEVLGASYGMGHDVILYEPARYSVCEPLVHRCSVGGLTACGDISASLLYIVPREARPADPEILRRLAE